VAQPLRSYLPKATSRVLLSCAQKAIDIVNLILLIEYTVKWWGCEVPVPDRLHLIRQEPVLLLDTGS